MTFPPAGLEISALWSHLRSKSFFAGPIDDASKQNILEYLLVSPHTALCAHFLVRGLRG